MLVQLQSSQILHKIHSDALPLGEVVLGLMKNCKKKKQKKKKPFLL